MTREEKIIRAELKYCGEQDVIGDRQPSITLDFSLGPCLRLGEFWQLSVGA